MSCARFSRLFSQGSFFSPALLNTNAGRRRGMYRFGYKSNGFLSKPKKTVRSKYKKAQQLKTKVIDEDGLFKMLRDSIPNGKSPPSGEGSSAATTASRKVRKKKKYYSNN